MEPLSQNTCAILSSLVRFVSSTLKWLILHSGIANFWSCVYGNIIPNSSWIAAQISPAISPARIPTLFIVLLPCIPLQHTSIPVYAGRNAEVSERERSPMRCIPQPAIGYSL